MGDAKTLQIDSLIGTMVASRYRIERLLGEGGMGQVYLATHEAIQKRVAVKVLRREYSAKHDIVTRFQQEAISASRIKHPNVLDVFDFGQLDNGCFFLAMEFLEGHDLSDELEREKRLAPERGVHLALQICRALSAAHKAGVVHRDLKPENVFLQVTPDGEEIVKLVDFGIAQLRTNEEAAASQGPRRRLTRTGMIFGTPEYMAPEQAAGKAADLRVDIYALGVMMFEMFTGAVPFTGTSFMAVLAAHLNDPVPSPAALCPEVAISNELQAVILRMLAKRPDDRFGSIAEVAAAIRATPEARLDRGSFVPDTDLLVPVAGTQMSVAAAVVGPPRTDVATARTLGPGELEGGTNTLLAAPPIAPPRPKHALWVILGIGALGSTALTAYLVLGPRQTTPPTPTPTPEVQLASGTPPPSASTVVPAPSAAPAPTDSALVTPTTRVRLEIHTEPPGAVVFLNGAQVCDSSPCEVTTPVNDMVELSATKGARVGSTKVLAQREQKVTIRLAGAAGPLKPRPEEKLCTKYDPESEMQITVPCPKE